MGISELRELRQLREENMKLKRLVADLLLDRYMLQEIVRKKLRSLGGGQIGTLDTSCLPDQQAPGFDTASPTPILIALSESSGSAGGVADAAARAGGESSAVRYGRLTVLLRREGWS